MKHNDLKTFAVIGDPIDHTLSPTIHNAAFKHLKMNCNYIAYKIKKQELESGIESLKSIHISGFNVTIPHKINVLNYLDELDNDCYKINAVNTVVNKDGMLKGYNTDVFGFLEPFKIRNISISDYVVLLLGAGGVARAVIAACSQEHVRNIVVVNTNLERAKQLSQLSKNIGVNIQTINITQINEYEYDYDLIVNATPLGLNNEPSIISDTMIKKNTIVYDLVYRPMQTNLLKQAQKQNAVVIYGYEMLLHQAAKSFELWHNRESPLDIMKQAILRGF